MLTTNDVGVKDSTPKPTLGVVAISYNEERDLPRFIEHLLPWVDEIVIVDDGSTDRTQKIAEEGGAKVKFIVSPRVEGEYYSHQRNKGIDAATSDWLLHMDIDERVPPKLAKEIQEAINDPDIDAYKYRRLNYFLHRPMRGGAWQNWNQVHLAKRDVFRFGGMFHETCIVDAPDERIGQLQTRMYHLNDECYGERLRKSRSYVEEIAATLENGLGKKKMTTFGVLKATLKEFLYRYVYKKGFRDGGLGILSAMHSTSAVYRAAFLIWDKHNRVEREALEAEFEQEWNG